MPNWLVRRNEAPNAGEGGGIVQSQWEYHETAGRWRGEFMSINPDRADFACGTPC